MFRSQPSKSLDDSQSHIRCQPFGKCRYFGSGPGRRSRAAMGLGRYISISSLDFAVGCSFTFGHEEPTFRGGVVQGTQTDVRKPMVKIQMKELPQPFGA